MHSNMVTHLDRAVQLLRKENTELAAELAEATEECRKLHAMLNEDVRTIARLTGRIADLRDALAEARELLRTMPGGGLSAYDRETWEARRSALLKEGER